MNLSDFESRRVVKIALSYLGTHRSQTFKCVDFVRKVYKEIGVVIPRLLSSSPPKEFNITREDLAKPPVGHLIFLKDRNDSRNREWTHVAIILPDNYCIHCSFFYGEKVIIFSLKDLFEKRYDFVESKAC